ncbi:PTS sugar transporter subunit IIA [Virgibacillus alimentarius]|uniref:PTS sugar transporter subunit IIA n=1 Tax=Virgibacillus alimentarius TaxID=698769 RepID=UPI0004936513|nr:PTS glucose transporter subunit IIA [Virgibacillus alimentarius]
MLGKFFKKKEKDKDIVLYAPVDGELVPLEEVPDPVFAQKMMGDGVAIHPANDVVTAPLDGEIIQLSETKHAIGIRGANGVEILIHIGLDTVNLKGEGFTAHIHEGDRVKKGDKLVSFDTKMIEEKATGTIIPIIITNTNDMSEIHAEAKQTVAAGENVILTVKSK